MEHVLQGAVEVLNEPQHSESVKTFSSFFLEYSEEDTGQNPMLRSGTSEETPVEVVSN